MATSACVATGTMRSRAAPPARRVVRSRRCTIIPTALSARGGLVGVARVDPSIRRGAVSVPHGHEGANVNWLTDADDIDRTTGMAHSSGLPVTLRAAVSA